MDKETAKVAFMFESLPPAIKKEINAWLRAQIADERDSQHPLSIQEKASETTG